MKTKLLMLLMVLLTTAGIVNAHTMGEATKTCPLCEEDFTCLLDRSGTQFGMRLDLKPLGPTPAPWKLPVCPICHFVVYNDEIPAEELIRCREIIIGEGYRKSVTRASYYLLGLLYEGLGRTPLDIGHVFLKASWQEESEAGLLKEDLERSLGHFEKCLASGDTGDEEARQTAQLLKGELLRRLGRFDEAKAHLKSLRGQEGFKGNLLGDIIEYELRLCREKDSAPHDVGEI